MDRVFVIAVFGVVVSGCGVSFDGKYAGPFNVAATTCSDGSTYSGDNGTLTMILMEKNDDVAISSAMCPGMRGSVEGNTVVIRQVTCPPQVTPSATVTTTFKTGSLTLNGATLTVSLAASMNVALTSGERGSCSTTVTATLVRSD